MKEMQLVGNDKDKQHKHMLFFFLFFGYCFQMILLAINSLQSDMPRLPPLIFENVLFGMVPLKCLIKPEVWAAI